jgi:hypothetical protein
MAPVQEDEVIKKLDRIMADEGFSKQRMHVTGKRASNLPDLVVYAEAESGESVIVGLEDVEVDDDVKTAVMAKLPQDQQEQWGSMEEFERGVGSWIKENSRRM